VSGIEESTNRIGGSQWDDGEPWYKECRRCGTETSNGNRYCEGCYFEVSGGPEADCPECGRVSEIPGRLCAQCVRGWSLYRADVEEAILLDILERQGRA
jgi:hypothetical protein